MSLEELWSRKLTRRQAIQWGGAASASLAVLGLAGCGTASNTSTTKGGGTLAFAQPSGPNTFDPIGPGLSEPFEGYMRQMFDGLLDMDTDLKQKPRLATSWKALNDTTWELQLRQGVKFHNGETFDANAVKFTIDKILDPAEKSTMKAFYANVSGAEVVDSHTVRVHLSNPDPTMPLSFKHTYVLPPKYVQANPDTYMQKPVGTGPFKFVSYVPGDALTLAANENYYLGKPSLDKVVMRIIPDDSARLSALQAGEIQIAAFVPLDSVDSLGSNPNLKVEHADEPLSLLFEFDTVHPGPVTDLRVRQALNYGLDKNEIARTVLKGKLKPLSGQVIPDGEPGFNPNVKMFEYDATKAKQLLADAGFSSGLNLALNSRVGKYTADRDIALAAIGQWKKIGVNVQFNQIDFGSWPRLQLAQKLGPMFMIGWFSEGWAIHSTIYLTPKSTLGEYYNFGPYNQLVYQASQTLDQQKANQLYQQAMQYMHDQAMAVFLFQGATYYGLQKSVQNFQPRGDEFPYFYGTTV